jgi:hypothetical protein
MNLVVAAAAGREISARGMETLARHELATSQHYT